MHFVKNLSITKRARHRLDRRNMRCASKSRRYRLWPQGYSICLIFLKLFERIYAPLTAGLLQPFRADSKFQQRKRTQLDRLYQNLDELLGALGLKAA
jgi:hypothetical protein